MLEKVQALVPPVGSVDVRRPWSSPSVPTTQRLALGHEIDVSQSTGALVTVHAEAPPVGSVEVTILSQSTAAQNEVVGHDTDTRGVFSGSSAAGRLYGLHEPVPAVGSLLTMTFGITSCPKGAPAPTATHNVVLGQATAFGQPKLDADEFATTGDVQDRSGAVSVRG
jgi:hypothetical protein